MKLSAVNTSSGSIHVTYHAADNSKAQLLLHCFTGLASVYLHGVCIKILCMSRNPNSDPVLSRFWLYKHAEWIFTSKQHKMFAVEGLGYSQTPRAYYFSLVKVFLTLPTRRSSYICFPYVGRKLSCSSRSSPRWFTSFTMPPSRAFITQLTNRISHMWG